MSLTNQELFNRVVSYARTMSKPARSPGGACKYRTEDGLACFVGCLIPDNLYCKDIEGVSLYDLTIYEDTGERLVFVNILKSIGIDKSQYKFLSSLQYVHDNLRQEEWEKAFKELARSYKLKVPRRNKRNDEA